MDDSGRGTTGSDDFQPNVAVAYTAAGIAAATAWIAVTVAGLLDASPEEDFVFGRREFYEAAAQIVPVLLLTLAVEHRIFGREVKGADTLASIIAFTFVLVTALVAELSTLVVLGAEGTLRDVQGLATITSVAAITGALTLIVAYAAVNAGVVHTAATILHNLVEEGGDHKAALQRLWRDNRVLGTCLSLLMLVAVVVNAVTNILDYFDGVVAIVAAISGGVAIVAVAVAAGRGLAQWLAATPAQAPVQRENESPTGAAGR